MKSVKTAVEVEAVLKNEYSKKLVVDGRKIPDPFKIPHRWQTEEEGMVFWPMILYPNIFVFNPPELGSNDLSYNKNCKAHSYYMSGWLQPLMYHNLTGSKFCIFKGDCRHSQSINNPFHKFWLIVEKTGKIRACHCTCMAGMGQSCNHVAAAMFRVEAAVRNGLTNPSCTSSSNEWLPCRKEVEPSKIKNLNLNREGFGDRGKQRGYSFQHPKRIFNLWQVALGNCLI